MHFLLAMVIVIVLNVNIAFAQEAANPEKVSGSIDIRNDFILPEKGEDLIGQSVNVFWQYKQVGGFLETDYKSKDHAFTIKPSLLLNKGSWYLLGGTSTNNQGSDFAQVGFWYINNFGKFKVLVDARNYFSVSGQSNGYTDNLLRVMYPITDKLSIGTDLAFDHWWNDGHNWYFVGPIVRYQLTERVSIYTRISHEWNVLNTGTETTDRIRVGLTINF